MMLLVYKSHDIIFPSYEQLKSTDSLLFNARHVTQSSCPFKVAIKVYVSVSHALIVLSYEPLYKIIPFDSNKVHKTPN